MWQGGRGPGWAGGADPGLPLATARPLLPITPLPSAKRGCPGRRREGITPAAVMHSFINSFVPLAEIHSATGQGGCMTDAGSLGCDRPQTGR